jgi:hypothetical protein
MKMKCRCVARSTGARCTYPAVRQIRTIPICGRHFAILKKNKRVEVFPSGRIVKGIGIYWELR